MCEIDDSGDRCDVYSVRELRARKQHKCDACDGPIFVGEQYHRHTSLYDGHWSLERSCLPCDGDRSTFARAHRVGLAPSSFADALADCVDEADPEDAKWLPMLEAVRRRRARPEESEARHG